MPAKAKITKEMIIDAAVEVVRRDGAANLSARSVAQELNCSTQPVMYHFATIRDLKQAAYEKADRIHTEYLLDVDQDQDPLAGIGLNYLRFAAEEENLFRFLFQSGYALGKNITEVIESEETAPVVSAIQDALGLSVEKTKELFVTLALFAHGYASLIANHAMEYEEKAALKHLERVFTGAIAAAGVDEK